MFKLRMTEVGVSPDRAGFGWATKEALKLALDRGAQFIVLAGDEALSLVRSDLSVKECHGRAMLASPDSPVIMFPMFHPEAFLRNPRWRLTAVDELSTLKVIGGNREKWLDYVPDSCVRCRGEFHRVDDVGVVYCEAHWGKVPTNRILSPQEVVDFFNGKVVES